MNSKGGVHRLEGSPSSGDEPGHRLGVFASKLETDYPERYDSDAMVDAARTLADLFKLSLSDESTAVG